jgi:dienelactone hydrolase
VTPILAGCGTIHHTPPPVTGPDLTPTVRATDPPFTYRRGPIPVDNHIVDVGRHYRLRRLTFPSVGDNGQPDDLVTVDYHQSTRPGRHPAVIILPIWGRHVYPSNAVTRTLRKRSDGDIHVLNVLGERFLIDWPALGAITDENTYIETWVEGAERERVMVIDIRRLIDWAATRAEIDEDRIGLIGFSHGAMLAPTIAIQEPRIDALVLVMGGAQPHRVIARCVGARTETVQDWASDAVGWTPDDMEARLEPIFAAVDPANYPDRIDPSRVLIFDAGRDECVPASSRDALWRAMGRPERYTIDRNHRRSFYSMTPLRLNWMRKKIWKFFERVLLEGDASSGNGHGEVGPTSP